MIPDKCQDDKCQEGQFHDDNRSSVSFCWISWVFTEAESLVAGPLVFFALCSVSLLFLLLA